MYLWMFIPINTIKRSNYRQTVQQAKTIDMIQL